LKHVCLARGCNECGHEVLVRRDFVDLRPGLDHAGPAHDAGHAVAAFPVGILLALERRRAAIGPGKHLGAVVGRPHDDGVVGNTQVVELLQELTHHAVQLGHAVGHQTQAGLALRLRLEVSVDVHARRIEPTEERLPGFVLSVDEIDRGVEKFLVDRFHPLLGQRAGVIDGLLADAAKARVGCGVVLVTRLALEYAARTEFGAELGILRVVFILWLFLGVEVVEVAEELVESVHGWQEFIAIAEVILSELTGRVPLRFEQFGERRIFVGETFFGARQADLQQAGAKTRLPGDERRASRRAGLLRVVVGEDRTFLGEAVDVGRAIAHHAATVGADVPVADVVAEDDENVGFLLLRVRGRAREASQEHEDTEHSNHVSPPS